MKMKLLSGYLDRCEHNGLKQMLNWFLPAWRHRLTQHSMFANAADRMAGGTAATLLIKFQFRLSTVRSLVESPPETGAVKVLSR